jgi:hypothetical protein
MESTQKTTLYCWQVLGSAFSATALFLLGLRMVGKVHTLQGAALVVPGILIAVKLQVSCFILCLSSISFRVLFKT